MNDSRMLKWFSLYKHAQYQSLFHHDKNISEPPAPNLLDDKGYLLIFCIMTPYKEEGQHTILKLLYNRKHKCGRSIIENSLGILKNNNGKLIGMYNLHITFILNVFINCRLLHNLLHNQGDLQVERLMHILKNEVDNT